MELHRDTGRVLRTAVFITLFGAVGVSLPALLDLLGREFVLGPWLAYGFGGIALLVGLYLIYSTLRYPFRFVAGDTTLTVWSGPLKAEIPWESLAAVTIERSPHLDPSTAPQLILWPAPGVDLGVKPDYHRKRDDVAGHSVIQLDDLRESYDEVVAVLQSRAKDKLAILA
jgi:hypothetical protein